jgi:hypothetical protein
MQGDFGRPKLMPARRVSGHGDMRDFRSCVELHSFVVGSLCFYRRCLAPPLPISAPVPSPTPSNPFPVHSRPSVFATLERRGELSRLPIRRRPVEYYVAVIGSLVVPVTCPSGQTMAHQQLDDAGSGSAAGVDITPRGRQRYVRHDMTLPSPALPRVL